MTGSFRLDPELELAYALADLERARAGLPLKYQDQLRPLTDDAIADYMAGTIGEGWPSGPA